MPNSLELLLLILQTISAKSVPNILFILSIKYILNAYWSSEVKTAGSIRVRSLVEGMTKLCILGIYQKDLRISKNAMEFGFVNGMHTF
jgi:hypothetical protein